MFLHGDGLGAEAACFDPQFGKRGVGELAFFASMCSVLKLKEELTTSPTQENKQHTKNSGTLA